MFGCTFSPVCHSVDVYGVVVLFGGDRVPKPYMLQSNLHSVGVAAQKLNFSVLMPFAPFISFFAPLCSLCSSIPLCVLLTLHVICGGDPSTLHGVLQFALRVGGETKTLI